MDFLTETFWTCTSCFHIDLCEQCYSAFKEKTLSVKTCSSSHEFVHMKPLQQVMRPGLITAGKKELPIREWLSVVREKWVGS